MSFFSARVRLLRHGLVFGLLFSLMPGVQAQSLQQAPQIQVGFSPEGSAEQLVLQVIDSARSQLRVMGYSFSSPKVVKALIQAKRRGVDVLVVVDARGNDNRSSHAAMNLLANAGIPLRTNAAYKIQHDKVVISDEKNVQTGSFNYSSAAAKSNSENVLVLWGVPAAATVYLQHWQSRWEQGNPYQPSY